jgi:hypothetical protein
VVARFVVDANGHPIVETMEVIEQTDDRFVSAVREEIPGLRFSPLVVGGKKVNQTVEIPFIFRINKDAAGAPNSRR